MPYAVFCIISYSIAYQAKKFKNAAELRWCYTVYMKIKKATRLGADIVPKRYTLHLHTDFETSIFTGEETIEIDLVSEQKDIILHSVGLTISKAILRQGVKTYDAVVSFDLKNELVKFDCKQTLKKGKIYLYIEFSGTLSESLAGFYKSTYSESGTTKMLATTQFEATDARRAFPCFDEPDKKAIFDISLSVPKGKTAISNTTIVKKTAHSKTHSTVHFGSTPIMSTYLLAFIIGDFEYIQKKTKRGIVVKVYTTIGKKSQAAFALECAVRSIDFYEAYFGIEYPLDKLDMVAIPDFAAGAMENWGAVTYRETALLFDEQNSSLVIKQYVAIVVAHELAHQWFGNLVTMSWWTDLWLNEGFASYMEYVCVDALFPDWNIWQQFVADDLGSALALDALKNTHAVEVEVHHPDDIGEVFDAISYQKGASLIRMLAEYLGHDTFQKGVQQYLAKHSYKNTVTTDLWKSFESASKKPVAKIMGVWTSMPGHPVITLAKTKEDTITVSQKRFFISPIEKNRKDTTIWPIPLQYLDQRGVQNKLVEDKIQTIKNIGFIKSNIGETGVYRTIYDSQLLSPLIEEVYSKRLSAEDRLGIIRDIHGAMLNCDISMKEVFQVLEAYRDETEYIVWTEILGLLMHLQFVYHGEVWMQQFNQYVIEYLMPVCSYVGLAKKSSETHSQPLLRAIVLGALVSSGDSEIIIKLQAIYKKKHIDPDLRKAVYAAVIKSGTTMQKKELVEKYSMAPMQEERNRIARARIATASKPEFQRTLKWIIGSEVRKQDGPMYIAQALYNRFNRDAALEFVLDRWQHLLEEYPGDKRMVSRIVGSMDGCNTKADLQTIKKFFQTNSYNGAERTLLQTLEQIEANIYFKKYHCKQLIKLFSK
jgi:puromycin-sensitive aminopeptidase